MACRLLVFDPMGEGPGRHSRAVSVGRIAQAGRREGNGNVNGEVSVLAAIDFSPHSRAAAARACELALVSDASVHLVHALGDTARRGEATSESRLRETSQHELESLRKECANRGATASAVCEPREPVDLILESVARQDAGLIVMGRQGDRRSARIFLGSVAEQTIRAASVPVMTVFEAEPEIRSTIRHILVATDFSVASERALEWTLRWARRLDADVEVFHAVSAPTPGDHDAEGSFPERGARDGQGVNRNRAVDHLQSILARMSEAGIPASADLTHGAAPIGIVKRAAEIGANLVVMGRSGHPGSVQAGFGRVADRVLRRVETSVLLVPGGSG